MQFLILKYKHSRHNRSDLLCLAPFSSLRFTVSGNIQVCCFNRLYTLGKYPDISISDAWSGERIKKLRNAIRNNDLTFGCGYCSYFVKNNLFKSAGAGNYDYLDNYYNKSGNYPVMLDFELGNNCNLECIMCNGENSALIRQNRENKLPYTPPYDNLFIEQLDEFIPHLKEARFVGGEPFLIDLNYRIWDRIIEINPDCKITVLTNGTVLNDKIKTLLNKGNFILSVSSDGITKETYEKVRKNADFDIFKSNLNYFLSYSEKKHNAFFLNFCPMIHNWFEIPAMFSFCNKNNIHIVLHTIMFPPDSALWSLPETKLKEIKDFLLVNKPEFSFLKRNQKSNSTNYESLINQTEKWISLIQQREKTIFSQTEMKKKLFERIKDYVNNSYIFDDNDKSKIYNDYILKVEEILTPFNDSTVYNFLFFLNSFNIELIIAELTNSTIEKLQERLAYGVK